MSIENPRTVAAVSGIGTSFDVGKIMTIDMGMFPPDAAFRGFVSIIRAQFSSISSATTCTIRICADTLGDEMLLTDTTSNIFAGLTTTTKGTAMWAIEGFLGLEENDKFHVFLKVNNGSVTADYVEISWADSKS